MTEPMHLPLESRRRFDSASGLAEFLRTHEAPVVRVGCDPPHISDWLLTRIRGTDVLICLREVTTRPQAVAMAPDGPVFVGANSAIYAVDTSQGRARTVVEADGTFYEFVDVSESGATALFEATIVSISMRGEVRWRRDVDLVGDYRREEGRLHIDFFDGGSATLDLSTGELIA
jgi:hypothetical protein